MKHVLSIIGICALIWLCAEPKALDWAWFIGEIAAFAIMVLAFRGADKLDKRNTR